MAKKKGNLFYFVLGFVLLIVLYIFVFSPTGEKTNYEPFAQCLTDAGVKMYGTDWCHFCQDQKSRFGNKAFKLVDYVNCDFNQAECNLAGVEGYPTWLINGEIYQGVQSLEALSSLSGCQLESVS